MQNIVLPMLASLAMTCGSSDAVAPATHPGADIAWQTEEAQGIVPVTRPCLDEGRTIRSRLCYPVITFGSAPGDGRKP
ncbi:hypothetical protein [Cupriavidus pauculus]|uniref:Tannase/feruloyl esterase family alpha/beta hydrolase n=1 Tax=Cupriavidus pauculus TaxID=82633 RepID=A0A2N5C6S3_9BURK|nr:hypothetical protein [Cupriavidus pauculus]PLP97929.1 hypothetical protein CYJ10_24325 [Cupriavidus pauculus]